jgi:hypothetical protein
LGSRERGDQARQYVALLQDETLHLAIVIHRSVSDVLEAPLLIRVPEMVIARW